MVAVAGAILGWLLVALLRPASDLSPLVRTAERVESGRLIDLLTVEVPTDPKLSDDARALAHGLWAEARARRWADFGHGTRSASVALPDGDTDSHWVARALWGLDGVDAELTRRIDADPSPVLLEARARWRLDRGDRDRGLEDLLAAQDRQPNRRHTRLALARYFARSGALDGADELYQEMQADFPQDAAIWIEAYTTHGSVPPSAPPFPESCHPFERGRWELLQAAAEDGSPLSEAARKAYPDRAGYQRLIGDFLLARGQAEEALTQYERVQSIEDTFDLRVAMARARFALRLSRCVDPASLPATVLDEAGRIWGRVRLRPGHFEPLAYVPNERLFPEAAYRELADDPGPESEWLRTLGAVNRVGLAKLCLLGENPRRAAQYLERAASIDEDLVEPVLRARALIEAGRARAAVKVLQTYEETTPAVQWVRAEAWAAAGELEPALEALQAVLSSTTTVSPHAQLQAARWQAELGRTSEALESLRQVATQIELRTSEYWLEAELLWRSKDPSAALARARGLVDKDPPPRRGLAAYLAARALEDGSPREAEALYAEIVDDRRLPEDVWLRYARLVHARSRSASRRIVQRALGATRDPSLRRELKRLR